MKTQSQTLTHQIQSINEDINDIFDHFEDTKIINLEKIQQQFNTLSVKVFQENPAANDDALKALEITKTSLEKLTRAMSHYEEILESQLDEVSNNKSAFKAYFNSIHMEP